MAATTLPTQDAAAASRLPLDSVPLTDAAAESVFDSSLLERGGQEAGGLSRWMGWRLRLLVGCALVGCLALFMLGRWLGEQPGIDAAWRITAQGEVVLASASQPALRERIGQRLIGMSGADGASVAVEALTLQRSSRWIADDDVRARHRAMHQQLSAALATGRVTLVFADGTTTQLQPAPRGTGSLGGMFWLLGALALALYLLAMVVVLARPSGRHVLYALIALCQAGNLVFIAVESTLALALVWPFPQIDMPVRMALDLITAAAIVNAACLHPRRLPGSGWITLAAWTFAAALVLLFAQGMLAQPWWWTQGGVAFLGLVAIGLLNWSYHLEPHPFAMVLRRFGMVSVGLWIVVTLSLASGRWFPAVQHHVASLGSMIWYVFLASVLLLVPFLSKSQQIMREFALLAVISTVATSLDLLFVAVFALGQFASLTLALFLSLGAYAGARQWILNRVLGTSILTTERMFERLYRIAREVEVRPERTSALVSQLLRELFEPMEVGTVAKHSRVVRVSTDGSTMVLPVPRLGGDAGMPAGRTAGSIVLRFAQRGRRLFTSDDARLAERILEQLARAVAFDKAVEQGRSEERARLAQDLHDDIGARLLTLMYKAPSAEMEEYVRHTLKDLKTLTRGLAAPNHPLSHAAAEWKADLQQRLTAAHVTLGWSFSFDEDIMLSVVQWSALTRVLRELVSNVISHAHATRLDVDFTLEGDRLELSVRDDGVGRNPQVWSHGLGLGGVRKRVKQLGGEAEWRELSPKGVCCRVVIRELSARQ